MGTAAYMSPEQARGKMADHRADIWAFGVIVHELLTGKAMFRGESAVEILGQVLNSEPDIAQAPRLVQPLLRWCLEKERKDRLAAIGDARRLLAEEHATVPVAAAPVPGLRRQPDGRQRSGLFLFLVHVLHARQRVMSLHRSRGHQSAPHQNTLPNSLRHSAPPQEP